MLTQMFGIFEDSKLLRHLSLRAAEYVPEGPPTT